MDDAQEFIATQSESALSNNGQLGLVFDAILDNANDRLELDNATVSKLFTAVVNGPIQSWRKKDKNQSFLIRGIKVIHVLVGLGPTTKLHGKEPIYERAINELIDLMGESDDDIRRVVRDTTVEIIYSLASQPSLRKQSERAKHHILTCHPQVPSTESETYRQITKCAAFLMSANSTTSRLLFGDGDFFRAFSLMEQVWEGFCLLEAKSREEVSNTLKLYYFETLNLSYLIDGIDYVSWAVRSVEWVRKYSSVIKHQDVGGAFTNLAIGISNRQIRGVWVPESGLEKLNIPQNLRRALYWSTDKPIVQAGPSKESAEFQDHRSILVYCRGTFTQLSSEGQLQYLRKLLESIGHGKKLDKSKVEPKRPLHQAFLPIFDALVDVVQDGQIIVRIELLRCLIRFMSIYQPVSLESTVGVWVINCLNSSSRTLRILSGSTLPLIIRSQKGEVYCEKILKFLGELSGAADSTVTETMIMAWGQVARVCEGETLNVVLLKMMEGLLPERTVVNSVTLHELQNVADFRGETLYECFSPFWSTISIDVVKRLGRNKNYLACFSDALGMTGEEFLRRTASYTVPYLVLSKDYDLVKEISGYNTDETLRKFYLQHMSDILPVLLIKVVREWKGEPIESLGVVQVLIYDCGLFKNIDFSTMVSPFIHRAAFEILKCYDGSNYDTIHSALHSLSLVKFKRGRIGDLLNDNNVPQIVMYASTTIRNQSGKSYVTKLQCLSALSMLMKCAPNTVTAKAVPQICAILQACLDNARLQSSALQTWLDVVMNLEDATLQSVLNLTFSLIIQKWDEFSASSKDQGKSILNFIVDSRSELLTRVLQDSGIPSLNQVQEFADLNASVNRKAPPRQPMATLKSLLKRSQDENVYVVRQTVMELIHLIENTDISSFTGKSHKSANPIGELMRVLLSLASRFPPPETDIAQLCAQCLGLIGAVNHRNINISSEKYDYVLLENFSSAYESQELVVILLEKYLLRTYRALTDPNSQLFLAWGIQELLKFCGLDAKSFRESPFWGHFSSLSKSTLIPLLSSKYSAPNFARIEECTYPIFKKNDVLPHSVWLKKLCFDLMSKTSEGNAERVFQVCRRAIRDLSNDSILNFLLPYAALNVILTGTQRQQEDVANEVAQILWSPVEIDGVSISSYHQTVFSLVDYFTKWLRRRKAPEEANKRRRSGQDDASATRVEAFLKEISPVNLATRSFECKSYPRAIMYWEEYLQKNQQNMKEMDINKIYKRFQDIYSSIDDPDSLDGIAANLPDFNTDQQTLLYESTGRWDYALECYEATSSSHSIQEKNKFYNCLKQAGRYGDLLSRLENTSMLPDSWKSLAVEVSWLSGNWKSLEKWLSEADRETFEVIIGKVILAIRENRMYEIEGYVQKARLDLARDVSALRITSLAQCRDSLVKLHALADLHELIKDPSSSKLDSKLDIVGTDYAARRYLLAVRRCVLSVMAENNPRGSLDALAKCWSMTAKDARKEGQFGLALQASVQAQLTQTDWGTRMGKVENARVLWEQGEQRKAPQMLNSVIDEHVLSVLTNYLNFKTVTPISREQAKVAMLYVTWLDTSNEEGSDALLARYKGMAKLQPQWEKVHYKLAKYFTKLVDSQQGLPESSWHRSFVDGEYFGLMILNYLRSLQYGVKYIYETLPKLVTVWLDFGANLLKVGSKQLNVTELVIARRKNLFLINDHIRAYSEKIPGYIFYVVISQLLSRMSHPNAEVKDIVSALIVTIAKQYPNQALWYIFGSVNSSDRERNRQANSIIDVLKLTKNNSLNLRRLVEDAEKMTTALIELSKQPVDKSISHSNLQELKFNRKAYPSSLVVPVQRMMSTTLPSHPNAIKNHKAFPTFATIYKILPAVTIQSSLQRPKRIIMVGSDGQQYKILCKANDDVRKDARHMEFARTIDKLLGSDDEAKQRHLCIKTYNVMPTTEASGLIEWVDGSDPMRNHITMFLKNRDKSIQWTDLKKRLAECKTVQAKVNLFEMLLEMYPSVLYEWFIANFPDPSSWLEARTTFVRTTAVMSMVGYIIGLGDRHAENLLLIKKTGALMHVDFDMIFDRGLSLHEPERVPFRLTQQVVGAMGISGYEGVFRRSCEVSLHVLRAHEDMLMTVLEPFLHEPFMDWTGHRAVKNRVVINGLRASRSPEEAFATIRHKIRGIKDSSDSIPLSVTGQVEYLIKLATSKTNLSQMYIGWAGFL